MQPDSERFRGPGTDAGARKSHPRDSSKYETGFVERVYLALLLEDSLWERASPRLTCARRRPSVRLSDAFLRAASLTCMRLCTATAPAFLANRVAVPLCCTTSVLPSSVATPPCTCTWK